MKKQLLFLWIGCFVAFGLLTLASADFKLPIPSQPQKNLRHVVLIDFNDQATDSVLQNIESDLYELKENIQLINKLEWGVNLHQDAEFSHCLLMTFKDFESMAQYEQHPKHLEFASTYGPYVAKMTQVDYWQ